MAFNPFDMDDDSVGFLDMERVASLESTASVSDNLRTFFGNVSNFFAGKNDSQLEKAFTQRPTKGISDRDMAAITSMEQDVYEAITVLAPKNLGSRYFIYAISELAMLREIAMFEERMLDPMLRWMTDITSGPKLRNVRPSTAQLRPVDLKEMNSQTRGYFKKEMVSDEAEQISVHEAFSRRSDIRALQTAVNDTYGRISKVSATRILAKEDKLAKMVSSLVARYESESTEGTSDLPKEAILELAGALRQTANEQSKMAQLRFSLIRIDSNLATIRKAL